MTRETVLYITRAEATKKVLILDTEHILDKKTIDAMTDRQLTLELNGRSRAIGETCYRIRKHDVNMEQFFKALMELTKADDYRDLMSKLNHWSYSSDFTYKGHILSSRRKFFKAFVISRFYDVGICGSIDDLEHELREELSKKDTKVLTEWFVRLGL